MKSPICQMLGIEFPLLAFSHCRDVVAAVSRAGGFGVLGATTHSPESIEQELKWIDDHVDGKPDGLVWRGTGAGGHCGEVSTMVLVPEVIKAIKPIRDVPVLAAGGIMTGRQMAACMAMGAAGVWTGSVWLATVESETSEIFREKMIAASSRDAIRSKGRTGKPARQLRSVWTDAWDRGPDSPG